MVYTLRAIFGAAVVGDFLLALLICLLMELRKERENAQIRKALTGFPLDETPNPDGESDEARRVREEANEEAKAWATLQHYNALDAYACREAEGGG